METVKQFLLTLKSPIKVTQQRADKTPMVLKTTTILVEWPLDEDTTPIEGVLVNLTVIAFTDGDSNHFWESPLRESGCEPFQIQLRHDHILSRQSY